MTKAIEGIEVVGGKHEGIPGATKEVEDEETFEFGNLSVRALHTPCHTTGHISYVVSDKQGTAPAVFSGDTLFIGGCGRFFEGNAEQMYSALVKRLGSLDDATRVFCGHEYTVSNYKFAVTVEPKNETLLRQIEEAKAKRAKGERTIPSTIGLEKATNPFMRVHDPAVQAYAKSEYVVLSFCLPALLSFIHC